MAVNLDTIRNEFASSQQKTIFLNHAGVSPIPRRTVEAMNEIIELNHTFPPDSWPIIKEKIQACRQTIARMTHVSPDEIAFSHNTTEGLNWVASGIDWRANDRIVSIRGEYPANIYPWMRLRQKGIIFHLIQPQEDRVTLEQINEALTPNTRLLTLSQVEFASGFRFDLEAVGELCARKNVMFLVDLIQGFGAFPVDLKKARVTFASCGSQKWQLGPQGAGFFYCAKENLDLLDVTCVGADTVREPIPYLRYSLKLKQDTSRFEYGTLPTIPLIGLDASLRLIEEAGADTVSERIHANTDILINGAQQKGYKILSPRTGNEWSGITTFTHPIHSNETIINQLKAHQIFALEREGRIRLAPHFYQTEDEMRRVVEAL